MEKRIASPAIREDNRAIELISYLEQTANEIGLLEPIIYYDYPLFRDENNRSYRPRLILVSRNIGVVLFALDPETNASDSFLSQVDSIIYAKLLKSPILRKGKRELSVAIHSVIFSTDLPKDENYGDLESSVITSFGALKQVLIELVTDAFPDDQWKELIAHIDGGKGIIKPKERKIEKLPSTSKAAVLNLLEGEIANFDRDQRLAAISLVDGPQRIRGLAGSGKTIVLAMKAANILLQHPDARILFTFWTKSLYDIAKQLITRFYRQFDERDPDWNQINILHAWGGKNLEGVYYNTCVEHGRIPQTFKQVPADEKNAFGYVCRKLIESTAIEPKYDYVLIDEGQDFPPAFFKLCFLLTKGGENDRNVIWAYDELQTILDTEVQNVAKTFGADKNGTPLMDLERAEKTRSASLVPHDIVLHRCYRNPPEILIAAHALGFGIYSKEGFVQMLENKAHWEDLGYVVETGNCRPGEKTVIFRPAENSPLALSKHVARDDIIRWMRAKDLSEESAWICNEIQSFLAEGLRPDDIMVVCMDDRNARTYFKVIAERLAEKSIMVNNVLTAMYIEPQFTIDNHVTLSTVYRAKGNEAAVVLAVGLDAIYPIRSTRRGRNKLFTAITRSKAWLRLSGIGGEAEVFFDEIKASLENFPRLKFVYPDLAKIDTIQRDLSERSAKIQQIQQLALELGLTDVPAEELVNAIKATKKK